MSKENDYMKYPEGLEALIKDMNMPGDDIEANKKKILSLFKTLLSN